MTIYTHPPNPSKQYAILRKIRGSRDQTIPGYLAPQEQIPWVRGCIKVSVIKAFDSFSYPEPFLRAVRRGALAKSKTGYHKNMVKEYIRY